MFNWDEFKKGKISIWCKTTEIAKNFLEECDKHDIKWNWREKTSNKTYWDAAKYNTCYFYELEYIMSLAWGSKQYAESEHYIIIDWSKEIDWNEVPKGTNILVRDNEENRWEERELIAYLDKEHEEYKYIVYNNTYRRAEGYKYAKLK